MTFLVSSHPIQMRIFLCLLVYLLFKYMANIANAEIMNVLVKMRDLSGLQEQKVLAIQRLTRLVCSRSSEGSSGETNTVVSGVEDRVEPLKESISVDEVKTLTRRCSDRINDEVNIASNATDLSIKRTREDLGIGRQSECCATDDKVQVLKSIELGGSDSEETGVVVLNAASSLLVGGERIGSDENESRTGVNNTSSGAEDIGSAEVNALVNTPEFVGWACAGDGCEGDGAGEFRRVSSAEREFSISYRSRVGGLE